MIVYIPCFIQYYNRFFARVVLVPFAHRAPAASIDTLDEILGEAHLALPQMIKVKGPIYFSLQALGVPRKLGVFLRHQVQKSFTPFSQKLKDC